MCGILGFVSYENQIKNNLDLYRKGVEKLSHRGPDAAGEFYDDMVYLGHRRLSIIDLSTTANQPFKSARENAYIIFNGEIYNYKELTYSLSDLSTHSDTEVLLEGYLQHGLSFFSSIRGMYAFAIYDFRDPEDPSLVLYRDLAGVKPLYYSSNFHNFAFSSEIKAVKAILNKKLLINEPILKAYINLGYCIEPQTVYSEIDVVKPGEVITIKTLRKKINKEIINNFKIYQSNNLNINQNIEKTCELLSKAVKRNLVADVDLAIALSGGIDSSLIFAIANENNKDYKGLSVKFNDSRYDETNTSRLYANHLKAPLEVVDTDSSGNLELLNKILLHFDQPYADSSAIPFYLLAKSAAKHTKVLIGGDGGDEIQNGYPSMLWIPYANLVANHSFLKFSVDFAMWAGSLAVSDPNKRKIGRIRNVLGHKQVERTLCEWQSWFAPSLEYNGSSPYNYDINETFDVYAGSFEELKADTVHQAVVKSYFYKRMLSDYLRKADMMSMINSIEYRVPMLDEDLVNFSFSIPFNQRSNGSKTKRIYRDIHEKFYPRSTSKAPKSGFSIPLDKWLTQEDFKFIHYFLTENNSMVTHYIRKEYIDFLFKSLNTRNEKEISRASTYQRILILYSLELWYQNI